MTVASTDVFLGHLPSATGGPGHLRPPPAHRPGATPFIEDVVECALHGYCSQHRDREDLCAAGEVDPTELWKLRPGFLPTHSVEQRDGWIWVDPSATARLRPTTRNWSGRRRRRSSTGAARRRAPHQDAGGGHDVRPAPPHHARPCVRLNGWSRAGACWR